MQTRNVLQSTYSADKTKTRMSPRSRLRQQLRRLFGLDTLPGPGAPHLRRTRFNSRPSCTFFVVLLFVCAFLYINRPFRSRFHFNPDTFAHPSDFSDGGLSGFIPSGPNDSHQNISLGNVSRGSGESLADGAAHSHTIGETDHHTAGIDVTHDENLGDHIRDGNVHAGSDTQTSFDGSSTNENNRQSIGNPEYDGSHLEPVDAGKLIPGGVTGTDDSSKAADRQSIGRTTVHAGDPNIADDVRENFSSANMSIVVLFHNEYDSLNIALASWVNNRLINYADEVLFFLNGVKSEDTFKQRVPDFENKIPEEKRRVVLSEENLPLGLAITRMVELAQHEYVLLLEKDWELIENEEVMRSRLTDSKVILGSGIANVVRHRHRHNPGVPLHALIMHQGREESIFRQQPNLLCYCYHWISDPSTVYPGMGYMRHCGGPENHVNEVDVYCASSVYCNWSNNPAVFRKEWFMEEVGKRYRKEYESEKQKHGTTSPFLDFEYYTNWRGYAWAEKNFTIALGTGLFRHAESEHQHFNTFWYAHFRLTVDLEEIRNFYLKNETMFKKMGGVHYDPNYPKPLTMMDRYPVEFVRKFQWEPMFTGTIEQQRQAINEVYLKYIQSYRVFSDEWSGVGDAPAKALKRIDWRMEITRLHNAVEKAMMLVPPVQPYEMNITLVTTLLDIGRDGLDEDDYKFRRDFDMYLNALKDWLNHKYKKVVYTSKAIANEVMKTASEEIKASTKFVYTTKEELSSRWIGPDNYAKLQEIRTSDSWRSRASWLTNSPQAKLEHYNPLVMAKMFMMRNAARTNPWGTTHFLFIDAKHNCRKPDVMTPLNDHIIRAHMFDKFLLTTFDYTPADEVHGFEYETFNSYCNLENPKNRQKLRVGRGGIFGGSAFVLEYMTAMYDVALTATLREGLMGTEENIFSILMYNLRQYVDEFSNNWACPDNVEKDHACKNIASEGYNCAIFDWVARDAVPWKE